VIWSPRARRALLTTHVVVSVGWLGAVVASLALAIAGAVAEGGQTPRVVYPAMELMARSVLLPLSLASLLIGVVQSLGSRWGLLEHYWVVAKLLVNLVASVVLLLYLETLAGLADTAAAGGGPGAADRASPVLHAGAAVGLLIAAVALSVYKPAGRTRRGWRKRAASART
jgi:hypothetical protein